MEQHTQLLIKAEKEQSFTKGLLFGFTIGSILGLVVLLLIIFD